MENGLKSQKNFFIEEINKVLKIQSNADKDGLHMSLHSLAKIGRQN
jgi:hypothetical protein